jgi:RNA polymerase sigma factor (sigma-70 family)
VRDFEDFFREEYDSVLRSLVLALGDRQAAEDGAQDAFASAYRRWRTVSRTDRPGTWVYVVALRGERRRLARAARRDRLGGEERSPDDVGRVLDGVWMTDALGALSERQRVAIVLRYYADLSVRDTAEVMGCAEGTVKATVHAALDRLRIHLAEEAEVQGAN